jgi:hypothetical protein
MFCFCLLGLYFGLLDFLLGFWLFALGWGLFAFEYWEDSFTLGLLVWEAFERENAKGKGKRIVEGKMLKGKGKIC